MQAIYTDMKIIPKTESKCCKALVMVDSQGNPCCSKCYRGVSTYYQRGKINIKNWRGIFGHSDRKEK